ncbi:unnamed protein product [Spodoptera littoralis]|uniref:THAP-type domain-containing protein n=1 Tax=Spodoptera littoralis TaxID=7109 RepID=A0A9P0IAY8_SPOLI|nr:unnamed protein product [Spodoptera littoralis]CAH1643378.1 unnamed protein product [Spodoptera littoralis]
MSTCAIKQCGARKNPNQPHLTMHRFPKNEVLRQKWLEVIGTENIKPGLKAPRICSLHFAVSSFNRTLDVIRLRDDAVPSIHLVVSEIINIILFLISRSACRFVQYFTIIVYQI